MLLPSKSARLMSNKKSCREMIADFSLVALLGIRIIFKMTGMAASETSYGFSSILGIKMK
jgi:hypothetical protein